MLTIVSVKLDDLHPLVISMKPFQLDLRRVRASIVNIDDLIGFSDTIQSGLEPLCSSGNDSSSLRTGTKTDTYGLSSMFPHIKRVIFPFIFRLSQAERVLPIISLTCSRFFFHDEQYIIFVLFYLLNIESLQWAHRLRKWSLSNKNQGYTVSFSFLSNLLDNRLLSFIS